MNSFRDQRCAPSVAVEVQQANVGRGGSDPIENRFVIVNPILSQMPVELDQRNRISE
jgi:hypothetical protein